mgnify:FL=1
MRKKINLILGALIALLCGCKSQKDIPMQSDRIMVLYGPPAYFQQQTNQQQETQQQTTPQQEAPQEASQKD